MQHRCGGREEEALRDCFFPFTMGFRGWTQAVGFAGGGFTPLSHFAGPLVGLSSHIECHAYLERLFLLAYPQTSKSRDSTLGDL